MNIRSTQLQWLRSIWLVTCFVSGCAPTVMINVSKDSQVATITGQQVIHLLEPIKGRTFILEDVDGNSINHGIWSGPHETVVKVTPGERRLVIRAQFNTGMGNPLREAIIPLVASVEAGKRYRINGVVKEDRYVVWLEDESTGIKTSGEASATYVHAQNQPGFVPIFVPIR